MRHDFATSIGLCIIKTLSYSYTRKAYDQITMTILVPDIPKFRTETVKDRCTEIRSEDWRNTTLKE